MGSPTGSDLHLREATNILLLAPSPHPMDVSTCMDLQTVTSPEETNVWSLGITLSANARIWQWEERVGCLPAGYEIITIGDRPGEQPETTSDIQNVTVLNEPGNLTQVGVKLTNALHRWQDDDRQTIVCLHSVTALMQYAGLTQVFKFLHKIKNEVEQADAIAHYHMDPNAHKEQTIAKIKQLFDTVIEIDRDDTWNITTREFEVAGAGSVPDIDLAK